MSFKSNKCGTGVQAQPEKSRSLFVLVREELYMYWVSHQQQTSCHPHRILGTTSTKQS